MSVQPWRTTLCSLNCQHIGQERQVFTNFTPDVTTCNSKFNIELRLTGHPFFKEMTGHQ